VLVEGERIVAVGETVEHPAGAGLNHLGNRTLLPGLIDAHVHLFLHPATEDLQTVEESVPQRTITATLAARADLMAGFTAERDMGTEGAGSAEPSWGMRLTKASSPARAYASAATPSTFWAPRRRQPFQPCAARAF
jgi:imidazolonepropionase-like amidohydrolase